MKTKRQFIGLALAAALGGGALFAQGPGRFGHGPRAGRWGEKREKRIEFIASYLGLTQTQQDQMRDLMERSREASKPIVAELRSTREALESAVKAGKTDEIQALAAKVGTLTGQLVATHAQTLAKLHSMLTPEQQAKAEKLRGFLRRGFGFRPFL